MLSRCWLDDRSMVSSRELDQCQPQTRLVLQTSLRLNPRRSKLLELNAEVAVAGTMHCVVANTKNVRGETFTLAFFFVHKCVGDCYNRLCQAPTTTPPVHTKWHYSLPLEPTSLPIRSQTRKTSTSTPVVLKRSSAKSES
jgi:hypothetical protein